MDEYVMSPQDARNLAVDLAIKAGWRDTYDVVNFAATISNFILSGYIAMPDVPKANAAVA